jgi:hypothetical protein
MARGYTLRAGLYQQPKDFQPIVLGKRGKRRDGICRFHISTNIEILIKGQAVPTAIRRCAGGGRETALWLSPCPNFAQPKCSKGQSSPIALSPDDDRTPYGDGG